MKRGMIRNSIIIFCIYSIWIILCFSRTARADTIWKIGNPDPKYSNSCEEFINTNQKIVKYVIPPEKNVVWEGFPRFLYPLQEGLEKPQEIWIDYEYPASYTYTALIVCARMSDPYARQYLSVYRGEEATEQNLIEKEEMDDNYHYYRFLTGPVKEGSETENRIILKTEIDTEDGSGTGSHIIFDILWLEEHDIDLDKDGVFNTDEGNGDWDQDGVEDQLDKDTACMPVKNADPDIILIRKIYLDITEQEGKSPSLKDAGFMDPNSFHVPLRLEQESFLYYGYLGFKVNDIEPDESVHIRICYPLAINDDAGLYTLQGTSVWERMDFDLQDTNTISITLRDGGAGDYDGEGDGTINSVLALYSTGSLGMEVEERGCFIMCVTERDKMCITKRDRSFHKGIGRCHKGKGR